MSCDLHLIRAIIDGVLALALIGLIAFGTWIIGRDP